MKLKKITLITVFSLLFFESNASLTRWTSRAELSQLPQRVNALQTQVTTLQTQQNMLRDVQSIFEKDFDSEPYSEFFSPTVRSELKDIQKLHSVSTLDSQNLKTSPYTTILDHDLLKQVQAYQMYRNIASIPDDLFIGEHSITGNTFGKELRTFLSREASTPILSTDFDDLLKSLSQTGYYYIPEGEKDTKLWSDVLSYIYGGKCRTNIDTHLSILHSLVDVLRKNSDNHKVKEKILPMAQEVVRHMLLALGEQ